MACADGQESDISCHLIRANAVFAIRYEPNYDQPFAQLDGRILEDGPNLHGELLAAIAALPALLSLEPMLAFSRHEAGRALRAIREAHRRHSVNAGLLIGEVSDCIRKGFDLVRHDKTRISNNSSLVKYIITERFRRL
jgi:hypothetical protein